MSQRHFNIAKNAEWAFPLRFFIVSIVDLMSLQSGHRFPSTRLLDADYGSILPNISKQLTVLQQLKSLLNEKGPSLSSPNYSVTPHHSLTKPVDGQLSTLERETTIKSEITEQISLLKRSVMCQEQRILGAETVVKTLLKAAKTDPASTAHALLDSSGDGGNLVVIKKRHKLKCSSGQDCNSASLPYSKFCLQHQWHENSQKLYPRCVGIDTDTLLKCSNTVHDIFSGVSLCPKHAAESALTSKRKPVPSGPPPKKVKVGASKVAREKKGGSLPSKTTIPAKVKVVAQVDELKAPPLASSWSSGGDSDDPTSSSTATLPQHISEPLPQPEACKPVASSKSLDDLLSLGSSLSAPLPKLDLLPLKADIGEIMMAGEDSSGDD